jgi:hypothetical protein
MRNSKLKGSINHSLAVTPANRERQKKLGRHYSSIDFEPTDKLNESNYKDKSIPIGTLKIGNKSVDLTANECNKLLSTLEEALSVHYKKIKLGL